MIRRFAFAAAFVSALVCAAAPAARAEVPIPPNDGEATIQPLAADNLLLSAARAGTRLVAVGEYGNVLLSDDQGKTWTQAERVPTRVTLTSVAFADATTGWAAGHDGVIIKTADAGKTWQRQAGTGISDTVFLTVVALDANTAIAMGAFNHALMTMDGGATWVERGPLVKSEGPAPDPVTPGQPQDDLAAGDPAAGVDEGIDDGTGEASADDTGVNAGDDLHINMAFLTPKGTIIAAAELGTIYRSTDKGATFKRIETGYEGSFWGGTALKDGTVLITGMRGNVWRSTDDGATFTNVPSGSDQSFAGATQFADGTVVLAGLSSTILVSSDNGQTFSLIQREDRKGLNAVIEGQPGEALLFGEAGVQHQAIKGQTAAR